MHLYTHSVMICIFISQFSSCMDTSRTKIITSDNKEYALPQWKIETSRVLYTKQQWQLFQEKHKKTQPAPLLLKTIPFDQLELYSAAIETKDFGDHFKNLSYEKQQQLTRVAGEQALDSSTLTLQLVKTCLTSEVIEHINSQIPIELAVNHLKYLIILDNCKQKNFAQETRNYLGDGCVIPTNTGYNYLPSLLHKQTNFCGSSREINYPLSNESNDLWDIDNCNNRGKIFKYFLTATESAKNNRKENTKKLWAFYDNGTKRLQRTIKHTNLIELSAFSRDGKYLATSSEGPRSELVLTDLTIENDTFVNADLFLTGFDGTIDWISFNNQATLLAALSGKKLYFWDVKKHTLFTSLDCMLEEDENIEAISFNNDDSRLATASWNDATQIGFVILWDISDIASIKPIRSIFFKELFVSTIDFTPSGDKLTIGTHQHAMLLDAQTGKTIMETETLQNAPNTTRTWIRAVLMQYLPFLVTTTHNHNDECDVALWDITSGKCIAKLLEKEKQLVGIGVPFSCRSIVSTTPSFDMIKTELYNNTASDCLDWSRYKMDLSQKYLLLRLCCASKLNDSALLHPDCFEARMLLNLPVDFKNLVEKHLLNK